VGEKERKKEEKGKAEEVAEKTGSCGQGSEEWFRNSERYWKRFS
jgi:hypothetical protein